MVKIDKMNAFNYEQMDCTNSTKLIYHYERKIPLLASVEGEISRHWQNDRYFGQAKFMAETAFKADKDRKNINKPSVLGLGVFFRCNPKPSPQPQS